jgi:hypothetical protein
MFSGILSAKFTTSTMPIVRNVVIYQRIKSGKLVRFENFKSLIFNYIFKLLDQQSLAFQSSEDDDGQVSTEDSEGERLWLLR